MPGLFEELKRRNVVRVAVAYLAASWLILQVIDLVIENVSAPPWVMQMILLVVAIGFPVALAISWAFELTPEGMKREKDVDRSESITHNTGRRLDRIIIVVLVVALGYFVWERQSPDDATTAPAEQLADASIESADTENAIDQPRTIAVLPFVNMSSDQEQEWFADGLTEEILNSLAKTPDLLVAARTSSFSFKGSNEAIPEIASALGVDHVLEGSVRRGGDTLRITAQLIRASDGFHLWSETYDRTLDDIIAIQEDIAIQIANALETAMSPEALAEMMDAGTNSVPAYEAYLKGVSAMRAAGESGDRFAALDSLESFNLAIELDPEFSNAYARLSFFWSQQVESNQLMTGITDEPIEARKAKRDEALENAILYAEDSTAKLNYQSSQAWNDLQYRKALRLRTEYVEKRPNDLRAFNGLVVLHQDLALHDEATALIRSRYEQYELTPELANVSMQTIRTVEDAEFMRTIAHETIDKFADDVSIMYQAHRLLLWASDIDGASGLVPMLVNSDLPETNRLLVELRQACAEQRNSDAAKFLSTFTDKFSDDIGLLWLAYQIFGDLDTAAALFDENDRDGDIDTIASYLSYTHFDPSRYPNFMRAVAGQGIEDRVVMELPFRCNR